ncbi:MAG: hypothetical protein WC663_00760 [Patescibacteria group bacterium]
MLEKKLQQAQESSDSVQIAIVEKTLAALSQEILSIVIPEDLPSGRHGLMSENKLRTVVKLVRLMLRSHNDSEWQFFLDFVNKVNQLQTAFDVDLDEQEKILDQITGRNCTV